MDDRDNCINAMEDGYYGCYWGPLENSACESGEEYFDSDPVSTSYVVGNLDKVKA